MKTYKKLHESKEVAMKLNRKFIGFEISKEYHELAEKRVNMNVDLFTSF
jgi:hypothetical protein